MKPLISKGSSYTPIVKFNYEEGTLEIKGRAVVEDPAIRFKPIEYWVLEYVTKPQKTTTLSLNMEYMNTGFVLIVEQILIKLRKIKEKGFTVIINWYYENEDEYTQELGEELTQTTSMQMNSIGLNSEIFDKEFDWMIRK